MNYPGSFRLAATFAFALAVAPRLCAAAAPAGGVPDAFRWHLPPRATIHGNILTVDVPEEEAREGCRAWAEIDLSAYDNIPFEATVEAWGERIGKPRDSWNGLKFQFEYENPDTGETLYPNTAPKLGDFPRQTLTVRDSQCLHKASPARIVLGLQDTSGKVSFDLSTLRIKPGRIFWPVTNQTHRCEYTERFISHRDTETQRVSGSNKRDTETQRISVSSKRDTNTNLCGSAPLCDKKNLRGVMSPSRDMTEDDFRTLREWGATLLRYQMNVPDRERGLDKIGPWIEGRLDHLDSFILPMAEKYGILVAVDLHAAPGGVDATRDMAMFHDVECAEYFVELWRRIARRFAGRRGLYGYDLVNEPVQTVEALPDCDFWNLQRRAAEAIREIDPETPIIIEANLMDSPAAFAALSPLTLTNVIYEVHMYNPAAFTHQNLREAARPGGPVYPDKAKNWNSDYLRRILSPVREFQERHGARIFAGEFSAVAWAQGAEDYLRDCIAIFNEYGWDWTYHAFRQWPGWSVEHEGPDARHLVPSADTPRKRALLEGLRCPQ